MKRNTIKCNDCPVFVTEPKPAYRIREKLKKLGWVRAAIKDGPYIKFVDRCGVCTSMAKSQQALDISRAVLGNATCELRQFPKDAKLEDMLSPWAIQ